MTAPRVRARPSARAASPDGTYDLLRRLRDEALDSDYAHAANRSTVQNRPRRSAAVGAAVLVALGVLLGLAAVQSEQEQPADQRERAAVLAQIEQRQEQIQDQTATLQGLRASVAGLQGDVQTLGLQGADLLDSVAEARRLTGAAPVQGPGMRITVNDAQDAGKTQGGTVLDADLQVLVNGLWQAGAEAISVNGQRIGPLTAIRTAGQAVNVNFEPLQPPYVLDVVGDPQTLQARFSETAAGQSWFDLQTNYGIRFEMATASALTLPAVPATRLRLHEAQATTGATP